MKVGYYAPLPPAPTGVADFAAALLEELRALGPVEVSAPGDVALYHLGNNQLHREIYDRALAQPGVAVLHDATLHHFLLGALGRAAYVEEFLFNYGAWSADLAAELWAERSRSAQDPRYFEHAMVRRIAERSRAVIVHNPGAARVVAAHAPEARVAEIPLLFRPPERVGEAEAMRWRQSAGVEPGAFLFGVFGHLRETKRLLPTLRAFARVRAARPEAALLVAGRFCSSDLERAAGGLLSAPGVVRRDYLPGREFWRAAAAVDACVNLRYPAAGETSAIAIQLMGIGKPTLVTEGEETSRYPEEACLRVPTGLAEEPALAEYMMWLAGSRTAAQEIGLRAAAHIAARHEPAAAARRHWELLCEVLG